MSENIANAASTRRPDGTHRVVITGMGAVSPAGVGVGALWDAVMGRAISTRASTVSRRRRRAGSSASCSTPSSLPTRRWRSRA